MQSDKLRSMNCRKIINYQNEYHNSKRYFFRLILRVFNDGISFNFGESEYLSSSS